MEFSWIVLSVGLALISLGVSGLLTLLFSVVVFACGALSIVLGIALSSAIGSKVDKLVFSSRQKFIPPKLKVSVTDSEEAFYSTSGLSISGSAVIEAPLSEILNYVFRDYIHSWHFKLTHSKAFPLQLQETIHYALRVLARRIQDVDWMPFLTTRLVDDVASHVRLFKKARFALKTRNRDDGKIVDLESLFFDAEVAMEGNLCRDLASSIQQEELNYLQQLADLLLFLLLPKRDFPALPLRSLAREILVNFVLKPMLEQLSDPDVINQTILWILKDNKIKPDYFISSIKCSESLEELSSTRDVVSRDIGTLRSMDSLGEKNASLKQQLNSLLYLKKIIDNRMNRLHTQDTDSYGVPSQIDWNQTVSPDTKLFILPLDEILKNGLSLSYFIDFMSSIGSEAYLFFYLHVEGWKVSAEQNMQALEFETMKLSQQEEEGVDPDLIKQGSRLADNHRSILMEKMREDAHSIYDGYLSEKANPRLKIDETVIKKLIFKIRSGPPDIDLFDDSQRAVYEKLEHDERFLDTFRRSVGYKTLLAELDLPKDSSKSDDEDDGQSSLAGDDFSIYDRLSINSSDGSSNLTGEEKKCHSKEDLLDEPVRPSPRAHRRTGSTLSGSRHSHQNHEVENGPSLKTEVIEFTIVKEGAKPYAQYTIRVTHVDDRGREVISTVYRRYSDFLNLHDQVCLKYDQLSALNFPAKKAFGNMDKKVLETRREMFDDYLKALIRHITTEAHYDLMPILQWFLDQESFESLKLTQPSNMTKAVRSSVKSVTHLVTSVPNNFIHSVDTVMDGISKVLLSKPGLPAVADGKVGAVLESDTSDNIPLRIMLLFMDEVFDLKERNQWLRRQIVSVLRQLVKAMFGDIVNRRIVDYFAQMTSPETISNYLRSLKESWWPDGYPAAPRQPRDDSTKNRTRVAARAALFSSFSDDLRRVIGSETAKSGVIMIFELLQHPVLNKRLAIVLLEGILETVFHQHGFREIFEQLHSRSNRVRNELKNSQRSFQDIRR